MSNKYGFGMIKVDVVTKYFGRFRALDGISFSIGKGEIVGFLGRNGAGKTTLMRILTGYLPLTSGRVFVCGEDIVRSPLPARRRIGYLPETPPLYLNMSVREYLDFVARMKDVPSSKVKIQVDRVLEECRLAEVSSKIIAALSKGYKQRVGIAQAIINDPQLLILDEPTIGLDPVQVVQVRELIKSLEGSRTVILSTHILSEIEQISKRVIIIDNGRIIKDASLSELLAEGDGLNKFVIRLKADSRKLNEFLSSSKELQGYTIQAEAVGISVELNLGSGVNDCSNLIGGLLRIGAQILEVGRKQQGLEQVFLSLMSQTGRQVLP